MEMEPQSKIDEALDDIIEYCQHEWGIFTPKAFELQFGPSTDAGYQLYLRNLKNSLKPILERYITK